MLFCHLAKIKPTYVLTANPLLSPPGGGGGYLFQAHLKGGLIETRGLLNLEMTMVWVLHIELEYKVEKLKCKMF